MITPVASDVVDSEIICGEVLLRVDITMLNPGQDRSMLVIYRVVLQWGKTLLRWGGAWNLQVWRLEVGTITPNPVQARFMLV